MVRRIINIDEEKCNGCGLCAGACHEGAIGIIDGKAKLLRDDYCDGLGDCLPVCPMSAISFIEREAEEYNEEAVKRNLEVNKKRQKGVCIESALSQWPVQIRLVPYKALYFNKCSLVIAADCTAYAYGNFHNDFIKNRVILIGCPKLDEFDYYEKLLGIINENDINDITVVRMEVPCCRGLENAVSRAIDDSVKNISLRKIIISTDGKITESLE